MAHLDPEQPDRPLNQLAPLDVAGNPRLPAPRAARPADEDEAAGSAGADPAAFLRGLRRRWALALVLGLSALGLASWAAWVWVPQKQTAQTLLRVEANQPTVLAGVGQAQGHGYGDRVGRRFAHHELAKVRIAPGLDRHDLGARRYRCDDKRQRNEEIQTHAQWHPRHVSGTRADGSARRLLAFWA